MNLTSVDVGFYLVKNEIEKLLNSKLQTKFVPLIQSNNFILAKDIIADRDGPPFNRVAMDGIAINEKGIFNKNYICEGICAAGDPVKSLKNHESGCLEVMTGCILPENTHYVIPFENTMRSESKDEYFVDDKFKQNISPNIHFQGEDYKKNDVLIKKNTRIDSTIMNALASLGVHQVEVYEIPKICFISTGDELVSVEQIPKPHQIRMSNYYAVTSLIYEFFNHEVSLFHLKDDEEELKNELTEILKEFPIILMSGGVSAGKFDFIPKIMEQLGATKIFHKLAQRPGKPFYFAKVKDDNLIFGLPGNPNSTYICARYYFISSMLEYFKFSTNIKVKLSTPIFFKKSLRLFKLVNNRFENGKLIIEELKGNGSGDFSGLIHSTGFISLPFDKEGFDNSNLDNEYEFYPFTKGIN